MTTRELWTALERDRIEIHLQSEVWLDDGRHFGFEALPVLDDEKLGRVNGTRIRAAAEHTAIALPLAQRLVELACTELEARDADRPEAVVGVCVPGLEDPNLTETVATALAAAGTGPERLCLEVPSHLSAEAMQSARPNWQALRDLGVRFALDGCGSNARDGDFEILPITALAVFPFDYVRLDRSLIRAVTGSARARRLVAGIAQTATDSEAIPVADGIATNTEAMAAFGLGCQVAMGPRFGRPLPPRVARAPDPDRVAAVSGRAAATAANA